VLGGGKFANGAVTGAFSYMFNHAMHPYAAAVTLEVGWGEAGDTFIDWFGGYTSCAVEVGLLIGGGGAVGFVLRKGATYLGLSLGAGAMAPVASVGGKVVVRPTRFGEKGVRITNTDGSVIDITAKRVKEFVPNTHPKAPPGALSRVKFDNAQVGSKGFKRNPTVSELEILKNAK